MFRRHRKFLLALGIGLLAGAIAPVSGLAQRGLVVIDLFSASYLALVAHLTARLTPEALRHHSTEDDEGVAVILMVGIAVVALSLGLVFGVLYGDAMHLGEAILAGAGIPLAWAMLQTLLAFHYARLHFAPDARGAPKAGTTTATGPEQAQGRAGGIRFEGTSDPGIWDFLYFSFTVGMTAQVSDTVTLTPRVRRMVLGHAVLSFFYNTVILALAVNVGASMAG